MNLSFKTACLAAGLMLGLALWGCGPGEPVKIGFVASTSGRIADIGNSGRDAVQMAVDECNKNGGINGRRVQLIIKNDRHDPETARKVVRELAGQGVSAIIGPMTSDMAVAVNPLLNEFKIVAVSATATTRALSGIDDYFYRVSADTRVYAARSAEYQIAEGGARRVAAVYDLGNRAFSESWLEDFKANFVANGGAVVAEIGFRSDDGFSFKQIADALLRAGPDCILIVANSMDSALICQQIRKADPHIPITLGDWGATERLLEMGGKAVDGVTVVQTFDRQSKKPGYLAFKKAFESRYAAKPGYAGAYAYDAAQVVLEGLKLSQGGKSLKETLDSKKRFKGLQGEIVFDGFGDVTTFNTSISVVRGHRFIMAE